MQREFYNSHLFFIFWGTYLKHIINYLFNMLSGHHYFLHYLEYNIIAIFIICFFVTSCYNHARLMRD